MNLKGNKGELERITHKQAGKKFHFAAAIMVWLFLALLPLSAYAVPSSTYLERNALDFAENIRDKYGEMVNIAALLNDYDSDLIISVIIVESEGNPKATSHKGAQGLMQLMPSTARSLGVKDSKEPFQNILGGTKYLRELERYQGFNSPAEALVAYNMGPSRARRWLSQYEPEDFVYVRRILYVYGMIKEEKRRLIALQPAKEELSVNSAGAGDAGSGPLMFASRLINKPRPISLAELPDSLNFIRRAEVESSD